MSEGDTRKFAYMKSGTLYLIQPNGAWRWLGNPELQVDLPKESRWENLPWWVRSLTNRGVVVIILGVVSHATGHVFPDWQVSSITEGIGYALDAIGVVMAFRGRAQAEKAKNIAVVSAAATGEIPADVTRALLSK